MAMCRPGQKTPGFDIPRAEVTTLEEYFTTHRIEWNITSSPWRPHVLILLLRFWVLIGNVWEAQDMRLQAHFVTAVAAVLVENP